MSFLSVFRSILHATEAAASIAAPIIKTVDPTIGTLVAGATAAAVSVEGSITAPNSGAQKLQAVKDSTQATVDVINGILASQGKAALPANVTDAVTQQVQVVVSNLNAVQKIVQSAPAITQAQPTGAPSPVVIQQ